MDNLVLKLSIRWLPAADAFSASCVSSGWRAALSAGQDNVEVWKQVCRNSFPLAAVNLEQDQSIDFRRLALGLWRSEAPSGAPPRRQPLRPDQVFAVVDLYRKHQDSNGKRRKEMVSSSICPIVSPDGVKKEVSLKDLQPILKGINPYCAFHEELHPWQQTESPHQRMPTLFSTLDVGVHWPSMRADEYSSGKLLRVSVTLFRRDNMKSVCIARDVKLKNNSVWKADEVCLFHGDIQELSFTWNDAGSMARRMMRDRGLEQLHINMNVRLSPLLPAPGSEKEPPWLANFRGAKSWKHTPSTADMDALSKFGHFSFGINKIQARLEAKQHGKAFVTFDGEDDLMTAIEGLHWE